MTIPNILQRVQDKGYAIFTRGDYNLNIIGVRSPSRIAGKFDDKMYVVFKQHDEWKELSFDITTDAGLYYLYNPMRVTGTAILVAGQYRGVYKLDLHGGKYLALCQRNGKVKVYRDDNKDQILDHDEEKTASGYYGINIHRSSTREGGSENVGKWSAGCQVFQNPKEYDAFIALCERSAETYGNSFTYTLLED